MCLLQSGECACAPKDTSSGGDGTSGTGSDDDDDDDDKSGAWRAGVASAIGVVVLAVAATCM